MLLAYLLFCCSVFVHQVKGIADLLKTNLEKGINGSDDDYIKRKNAFGSNTYPRKKGRSFWVNCYIISKFFDIIFLEE